MLKKFHVVLISLAVFLCGELIVTRMVIAERSKAIEANRYVALEQLATVRARLEGALQANLIAIRQLRTEFTINPNIDEDRFRAISNGLLSPELHIRHIAIGRNYRVEMIHPLEGNEGAVGFDYRSTPEQLASYRSAMSSGEITINGPVELVQGGSALIARVPVFNHERTADVIISQVIEHERLFDDAGLNNHPDLQISLRGLDGSGASGPLIMGDANIWQQDPIRLDVNLPTGNWALAAMPHSGSWLKNNYFYLWVGLAGTIVVLFISGLVAVILANQQRLRQAFQIITQQARFDSLTNLPNRHYFQDLLGDYIANCERREERFALLFIDLDHFKEVNDALGHAAGDELLMVIAQRLKSALRSNDIVARLGGDEFIVVLKNITEPVHAQMQAQKLLKHIHEPVSLQQREVIVNASIGIAIYPHDGKSVNELLKSSDLAMYNAKSLGRGTTSFFDLALTEQAGSHLELHTAILKGLRNNEFFIEYQPIINADSGELHSIEALVRWQHPEHGLLPPNDFIPIAEKSGAIRELGNFVLRQACMDIPKLRAGGIDGRLAVNFSSHQFYDNNAVEVWFGIMEELQVPPSSFTFEITESMLLPDRERQRNLLLEIHKKGVLLTIDDFGTGYSSTSYLQHFPISMLKIDKSFVDGVPENKHQTALLNALIQMASALEIDVVAEGVETLQQVQFLHAHCADLIQGFYFARPMPLANLIAKYGGNDRSIATKKEGGVGH